MIEIKLSSIIKDEYEFSVEKVMYERITDPSAQQTELSMSTSDTLTASFERNTVNVFIERNVSFSPQQLFKVSVSINLIFYFREDFLLPEEFSENVFLDLLIRDNPAILDNALSRISAIISSLTGFAGFQPLVTQPTLIKGNK